MGTARGTELLLWAQLLSLVGSRPPLLTMDPPWTPQFIWQDVKLTCGDPSVSITTTWYRDGRRWKETSSNHLSVTLRDEGKCRLQCRTRGSELSPAVNLTVSNDWLLLQVPAQAVLEGDSLSLRCSGWKNAELSEVKFFHDGRLLQDGDEDKLLLSPAKQQHSGRYRCSANAHRFIATREASPQADLVVRELFSVPVLSLEGPQEPPEGSALTLLCATHGNALRPHLSLQHLFYQDGLLVGGPQSAPQHRLPALLLSHSGSYSCQVQTETGSVQKRSAPITITVRRIPVAGVSLHSRPPGAQVLVGDHVVLSCAVAEGTGPLSFSWYRQNHTGVLGSGRLYELPMAQLGDGDHYHCTASNGMSTASSPQLHVTVTLPVSNASITVLGTEVGAELVGTAGEELTLSCRVGMGTGQVGFVWLRDGQELSTGPTWHLGVLGPEHAGTYQCVANNSLGTQRVFRARSPEVLLVVTQQGWGRQRAQVLAIGLPVSLLVLLAVTAALGWHFWRRRHGAASKSQHRDPTPPPGPSSLPTEPSEHEYINVLPGTPSAEDVLYSTVTIREHRGGVSPCGHSAPQEAAVTYTALPAARSATNLRGMQHPLSDSYENFLCK